MKVERNSLVKRINKALLILSSLGAIVTLSNCNPDNDGCGETKYVRSNLEPWEEARVAYKGYDTLRFIDEHGDTLILTGHGKRYFYNTVNETGSADCLPLKSTDYQGFEIKFLPVKGNLSFDLTLETDNHFLKVKNISSFAKNHSFGTLYALIGEPSDRTPYYGYYDSLEIGGKYYYRVIRMNLIINGTGFTDDTTQTDQTAYINKDFGILSIADKSKGIRYNRLH